jgi:hypothetical protein
MIFIKRKRVVEKKKYTLNKITVIFTSGLILVALLVAADNLV